MVRRMEKLQLFIVLVVLTFSSAQATPILWTFSNAMFDDGGLIQGSFEFDAATSLYSNIAITTTPGTSFGGAFYDGSLIDIAWPESLRVSNDATSLWLGFNEPLTAAGGEISLYIFPVLNELQCTPYPCSSGSGGLVLRQISGGSVTAPAPAPSTGMLLCCGLLVLGFTAYLRRDTTVATARIIQPG